jgi:hypothetical protein
MNQPHTTLAASGGAGPQATLGLWPQATIGPWPQATTGPWPPFTPSALMRLACATNARPDAEPDADPVADGLEGEGLSPDGDLDTSAAEPLPIAALGQTPSGLEVWTPLLRSADSLNLLGGSGAVLVGVNELGWVVYDWVPGP